jgi:hypothetical protein
MKEKKVVKCSLVSYRISKLSFDPAEDRYPELITYNLIKYNLMNSLHLLLLFVLRTIGTNQIGEDFPKI